VVGVWLLWDVWLGRPVAAAFTRIGGATRVETAVEASRFWLTPPRRVVMTPAGASQQIMLGAARCAMVDDAPLLFTSPNPTRRRLVNATIGRWQQAAKGSARREVILNQRAVTRCLANANPADVNELPMLGLPNQPFQVSRVAALAPLIFPACATPPPLVALPIRNRPIPLVVFPACARPPPLVAFPSRARPSPLVALPDGGRLAPVVVFAAAKAPRDPPDVAVGLALAAHMAMTHRQVSLVVVPRYLEADLKLEDQLRKQRQVVEGGVVLGSARVLPSDTRALLRQLLTSTDRQGVLGEIRTNLGSVGPLIAALLALLGLGAAARKAPEIGRQAAGIVDRIVVLTREGAEEPEPPPEPEPPLRISTLLRTGIRRLRRIMPGKGKVRPGPQTPPEADWLTTLGLKNQKVTVWLSSGWKVTGTVEGQYPAYERQRQGCAVTLLRLNDPAAESTKPGQEGFKLEQASKHPDRSGLLEQRPTVERTVPFVLVPVEDIELIRVAEPATTKT
jgi:hypothetical protein